MLDKLQDRFQAYLSSHSICTLITQGMPNPLALIAKYFPAAATSDKTLQVDCLIPRWADITYHLEQNPGLILIIPDLPDTPMRWLQYRGSARPLRPHEGIDPAVSDALKGSVAEQYQVFRVIPWRVDLIDEDRGWGVVETLDC